MSTAVRSATKLALSRDNFVCSSMFLTDILSWFLARRSRIRVTISDFSKREKREEKEVVGDGFFFLRSRIDRISRIDRMMIILIKC